MVILHRTLFKTNVGWWLYFVLLYPLYCRFSESIMGMLITQAVCFWTRKGFGHCWVGICLCDSISSDINYRQLPGSIGICKCTMENILEHDENQALWKHVLWTCLNYLEIHHHGKGTWTPYGGHAYICAMKTKSHNRTQYVASYQNLILFRGIYVGHA